MKKSILLLTTCLLGGLMAGDPGGPQDGSSDASPLGGGTTLLFGMFPTLEKDDNFKHFALIPVKDFDHFKYAIPHFYRNSCFPIMLPLEEIMNCDKERIETILTEDTHTGRVAIRKFCYVEDLDKEVAEMKASFEIIAAEIEKSKKNQDIKSKK